MLSQDRNDCGRERCDSYPEEGSPNHVLKDPRCGHGVSPCLVACCDAIIHTRPRHTTLAGLRYCDRACISLAIR